MTSDLGGGSVSGTGNEARARGVVAAATDQGVSTWCVAPGGRNAPLVAVLEKTPGLELISHYDERSAGFFALGRARRDCTPVAVTTTSGTAVAELLPSAIEAHYSGTQVLFVTADRPQTMRGSGAPQAIEQQDLLAPYAPMLLDSDAGEVVDGPVIRTAGPSHWNVAFDEPLFEPSAGVLTDLEGASKEPPRLQPSVVDVEPDLGPDDRALAGFTSILQGSSRPLVLVGGLEESDIEGAVEFLVRLNAPVYAEATSGLRRDPRIQALRLLGGDRSLSEVAARADAVIRLGDVPAVRLWRDVGAAGWPTPVASLGRRPFAGRDGGPHAWGSTFAACLAKLGVAGAQWDLSEVRDRDAAWAHGIDRLLAAHPNSEPAMVRGCSKLASGFVYLGNSLPIREWDAFATRSGPLGRIRASRGANGIDGQLSTFFGLCRPGEESWALLGDLTTLYDLGAPWLLDRIETGPVRIVVINNGGGRIFDRVFPTQSAGGAFRNAHEISFGGWAAMWSIPYLPFRELPLSPTLPERVVVELRPDEASTAAFWKAYVGMVPEGSGHDGVVP